MWRRDRPFLIGVTRNDAQRAPRFATTSGQVLSDAHVAQLCLGAATEAFGAVDAAPSPKCAQVLSRLQSAAATGGGEPLPAIEHDTVLLATEGYLRGAPFSPNDLVHVPGVGDLQVHAVEILPDPCPPGKRSAPEGGVSTEPEQRLVPDEAQEPLQQFNVPDPTLGEQTWPTEEELVSFSFSSFSIVCLILFAFVLLFYYVWIGGSRYTKGN